MKLLNKMAWHKIQLFVIVLLFSFFNAGAQSDCACCTDDHKQFDFWVGEWNVYDTAGNKVGENAIVKLEKGCIINEHWKSARGGSGRSYNYFDPSDSTWNQLWIDSQGNNLKLKGHAKTNEMILSSELVPGQKIDFYRNRITWTQHEDESVTQLWEILDKNDKVLSVAFKGIYKRK